MMLWERGKRREGGGVKQQREKGNDERMHAKGGTKLKG